VGVKSGREGEKAKGGEGLSQKQRVWFGEYATAGKKALTTGSAIITTTGQKKNDLETVWRWLGKRGAYKLGWTLFCANCIVVIIYRSGR